MIPRFFIARPVLANVLAILVVLIGAVALLGLPVAQYPDIVPPTVQVTTRYPGASAQTVVDTVARPIEQQSQQVTAGQVGTPPAAGQAFHYTVNVAGRLRDPAQFGNVIVKVDAGTDGRVTRVRDLGRVELGAQTYGQVFTLDGRPAAGLAIFQLPGANALDVAGAVRARMAGLARDFPQGLAYAIPFDTTRFVRASVNEVYHTLIEAGVLVLLVILVFLQDWRAKLVPATTVPITIVGAFAVMTALSFTVNLSTLFAVVLAIGIVLDDAIVVVEAASRHVAAGLTGRQAATRAMGELFGPIIGITLVLMSVFLPAAFLPGLKGRMFAQFALVIAATAAISAVNAATLKPVRCASWLRPPAPPERRNPLWRGFNRAYDALERRYAGLVVVAALLLVALGG